MGKRVIFITGATGFVGAGLAVYYLRRGATVFALCRGGDPSRVERALLRIDPSERWRNGTLRVVPGDVTLDEIGLTKSWSKLLKNTVDIFIHAAGHIRFETEDVRNIEVNFFGSRKMAEVARGLSKKRGRFIYISTAYVCGTLTGDISEVSVAPNHSVHNNYEYSKILAEHAVQKVFDGTATIIRPSIAVGPLGKDWEGSTPVTFAGYYGYFKGFNWLRYKLKPEGGSLDLGAMRIPGDSGAEINLIPLDNLVEMVDAVAGHPETMGGIFHATNPQAPQYEALVRESLAVMGITGGRFVLPDSPEEKTNPLSSVEELIKGAVWPFMGYVAEKRRFRTDFMGQYYPMNKIPSIGAGECRKLLAPALAQQFKAMK